MFLNFYADSKGLIHQKKSAPRDRAAADSSKGSEDQGEDCRFWTSKCSCSKGGKCAFEHDPAKKGKVKGNRSRSPVQLHNSAERQCARKTGKVHLEKKISYSVQRQKRKFVVMIEIVIVGIPRIATTSRKIHWERNVPSPTHKRRNDLPVLHKKNR